MLDVLTALLAPLLVVVVFGFLIYRFGFFSGRYVGGRGPFVAGGLILLIVSLWELVELVPDYGSWFVLGAYAVVDLAEFLLAAMGLFLAVIGLALYADYWQVRREEVNERLARLSVLENLQHDSRQPYHLLDLLNTALREILVHYPMACGALFLVNRARRQFVLTSSSGLRKEEVVHLEYYPLERNAVSQAIDLGDPMLLSQFDFFERSGTRVPSRFNSVLILPLISGLERIGGLLLFSDEARFFGTQDIKYLSPVAEWLAEKIKATRLARLLVQMEKQRDEGAARHAELAARFGASARAAVSSDAVAGFCRTLVGLADAESVHLCGVKHGTLVFHGGSEPPLELSENLRAALVEGIERARPLIVNQESAESDQGSRVVQSSLLCPLAHGSGSDALLLIKSGRPFSVDETTLKLLDNFAQMAGLILRMEDVAHQRLGRRKGFEVVLQLLQSEDIGVDAAGAGEYFIETIGRAFARKAVGLVFSLEADSDYRLAATVGTDDAEAGESLRVEPGEGGIGAVLGTGRSQFVYGRSAVARHLESYHEGNRAALRRLFGERGLPDFLAYCSLSDGSGRPSVALIAPYALEESERAEWERLLTLAAGLFSLRLAISRLTRRLAETASPIADSKAPNGDFLNQLNNHLSAVIGVAELAVGDGTTPEPSRRQFRQIMARVEQAAEVVRRSLAHTKSAADQGEGKVDWFSATIERELGRIRLSGNLYMVGQRPREIGLKLTPVPLINLPPVQFEELFRSLLGRFAAAANEDDMLAISTYVRGRYVYLDISRHRRNFPPVEPVAGFGRYLEANEAFRTRPADVYLRHVQDSGTGYAFDQSGGAPAYLSFRFLVRDEAATGPVSTETPGARILAIDDQQIILDLITAMGQSLGYSVRTATSAEEGIRLAEQETFDVVLTDFALPRISGLDVARRISHLQPGVPIILVTGWTTGLKPEEMAAAGISHVLYKPFRIEQLTAVVRALVADRASS